MDLNLEEWRTGASFSCMNNEKVSQDRGGEGADSKMGIWPKVMFDVTETNVN